MQSDQGGWGLALPATAPTSEIGRGWDIAILSSEY